MATEVSTAGGTLRVDPGDHPAQANAVAHAPSHYDPLKTEWSQPEVAGMKAATEGTPLGMRRGIRDGVRVQWPPWCAGSSGVLPASARRVLRVEARQLDRA